ncbi:rhodanese-like domain-containing protein [Halobacterium sp. CBA1126]|uniref:rhodanese-like domain-containing protein n=1 Tax=Halobacterium TaxID=2239 RepID=UPI0012FC5F41|nr:rhodanese-like domain-containing protein [Halobacterium sp. CBA1126]MUV59758.1 rhodanese-like domain-containing protein [Halobacterium sp. CBA1126]
MDGEISADELEALLDDGEDVRVVDIRPRAAFERGHIPDSENIPFAELPQSVDRLEGADRVVTVCPHGQASVQAARLIQSYEGLDEDARVESLAEGITGWEGDVETSDDEGPDTETTESPF